MQTIHRIDEIIDLINKHQVPPLPLPPAPWPPPLGKENASVGVELDAGVALDKHKPSS